MIIRNGVHGFMGKVGRGNRLCRYLTSNHTGQIDDFFTLVPNIGRLICRIFKFAVTKWGFSNVNSFLWSKMKDSVYNSINDLFEIHFFLVVRSSITDVFFFCYLLLTQKCRIDRFTQVAFYIFTCEICHWMIYVLDFRVMFLRRCTETRNY